MSELIGQSVGRYHIVEKLGQGGMAIVYKAFDTRLDREVAIKFIRMDLVGSANTADILRRFEREAKALARLAHPNIVHVHDYGEHEGAPYLVMEYLGGGTIKSKLAGKPVPYQEAAHLLSPIAHALAYAHENNVIHRDIKPANILLTLKGLPMLSDFGIAKILDTTDAATLTGTGVGLGTPEYMSPEQGAGKKDIDYRTDIYALGVVFYEMVAGRRPYEADTPVAVVIKHMTEPLPRPRQFIPDLPEEVEHIIFKAMAKAPADRYQNMELFAQALEKLAFTAPTILSTSVQEADITRVKPVITEQPQAAIQEDIATRTQVSSAQPQPPAPETAASQQEDVATRIQVSSEQPQPVVPAPDKSQQLPVPVTVTSEPLPPVSITPPTPVTAPSKAGAPRRPISRRVFIGGAVVLGVGAVVAVGGGLTWLLTHPPTGQKTAVAIEPTQTPIPPTPLPTNPPVSPVPTITPPPTQKAATAQPTATAKSTEMPATWPRGGVHRNRTLIRGGGVGNAGIANPMNPSFNHQNGFSLLLEPCAYYNPWADKTTMWLVESYKYNSNATELTISFRQGITWSDGVPFTANDVAFGMTKLKTVDGLNRSWRYKNELDSVTLTDDYTLNIKLKGTDWRFFFNSLTFSCDLGDESVIVPQHIFKDVADADLKSFGFFDPTKGWPVVTSPYTLVKSDDSTNTFDLRLEWWAVKTGLVSQMPDVIRVINRYESDAASQIKNNENDIGSDLTVSTIKNLLQQTDHVTTWTGKKSPYGIVDWWPISIYFNCMKPPFNDPKVRWAVAYAIDQQQVIDQGYGGAGIVTDNPFPAFPRLQKYLDGIKDLTSKYNVLEYNLDKSAQLMSEAGFKKDNNNIWVDTNNNRFNADLYAPSPTFDDIAPVIVNQLRKAGFPCQRQTPDDVWTAMADGRAPLFLWGHNGATIDPLDTFNLYRKENIQPIGQQSWGNIGRWSNTNFQAIADQMFSLQMDDPKMMDLFHRGMVIWYRELPDCPLCQWINNFPFNTTYWDNWPSADNPYTDPTPQHLSQLVLVTNLKSKQ